MSFRRCLMLLVDGARADRFETLLAEGNLPHISRYIVEPGAYRRGTTVFPSTTGPAYLPFLTGRHPAHCDVPGIRWMDKSRYRDGGRAGLRSYVGIETFRINPDIRVGVETLFSLFPKSYNIFNSVCRDVGLRNNLTRFIRVLYWYYAHMTDRWDFVDIAAGEKVIDLCSRDFQFGFAVFPGVDEYGHLLGPHHPRTVESYRRVDETVGRVAQRLKRLGRLDDTLWWIVSDHGLSATHSHFCMNTYLEQRAWRPLYYPLIHRRGCRVANMMSGNGMTHLYFRHRDGWQRPVTAEYLDEEAPGMIPGLFDHPAIDLVAQRAENGKVHLQSRDGSAALWREAEQFVYHPDVGDPLDLGAQPHGGSVHLDVEALRRLAVDQRYPDALLQLVSLFETARCGDVVVSASPGYDLREGYEKPEHRGTHGSLHHEHMYVPIACNAPLDSGVLRTVDVFPTTLSLMAKRVLRPIDGVCRALS
jgi:hypothetical protein